MWREVAQHPLRGPGLQEPINICSGALRLETQRIATEIRASRVSGFIFFEVVLEGLDFRVLVWKGEKL